MQVAVRIQIRQDPGVGAGGKLERVEGGLGADAALHRTSFFGLQIPLHACFKACMIMLLESPRLVQALTQHAFGNYEENEPLDLSLKCLHLRCHGAYNTTEHMSIGSLI